MRGQRTPVTLYDVAAEAGVSHTTVSRAVRGERGMTPQTRRRVSDAVARLGYRPNSPAQALAQTSRPAAGESEDPAEVAFVVAVVPHARIDGSMVDAGRATAAGQAVDHLRSVGHRSIRRVRVPLEARLLEAPRVGAPPPGEGDIELLLTADEGYRVGLDAAVLAGCTAVVVPTASFALGLMRGLRERGIHVPADLSVVSLEDTADAAHFLPPLTAVEAAQSGPVLRVRASTAPPPDDARGSDASLPREGA